MSEVRPRSAHSSRDPFWASSDDGIQMPCRTSSDDGTDDGAGASGSVSEDIRGNSTLLRSGNRRFPIYVSDGSMYPVAGIQIKRRQDLFSPLINPQTNRTHEVSLEEFSCSVIAFGIRPRELERQSG